MSKRCSSCGLTKPISSYHNKSAARDGRMSRCKECSRLQKQTQYAANREAHRDKALRRRYGITSDCYAALLSKQGSVCAICKRECPVRGNLSVDHCHSTGAVRGLLCNHCNTALGKFQDSEALLLSAIRYLKEPTNVDGSDTHDRN